MGRRAGLPLDVVAAPGPYRPTRQAEEAAVALIAALGVSVACFLLVTPMGGVELEVESPVVDVAISPAGAIDVWAVEAVPARRLASIAPQGDVEVAVRTVSSLLSAAAAT